MANFGVSSSIIRRPGCFLINFTSVPLLRRRPWTNITFTQDSPNSYIIRYNSRDDRLFLATTILSPNVIITDLNNTCDFSPITSGSRNNLLNNI